MPRPNYFAKSTKKGELRELQQDLNSGNSFKTKETVKKLIAMTDNEDVVRMLFSDVIKSMGSDDIELKKVVYLYLIHYANFRPEIAILCVGMLRRDCTEHPNPLIRGLAIRTMSSIRIDRIAEYVCDPIGINLNDKDPYVRKTTVISVAKLYHINPELVEERQFIEKLRTMLNDANPMIVANVVAVLSEISQISGVDHFRITNQRLKVLLTALNECTLWGRVYILDALSKFEALSSIQAKYICDHVIPQLEYDNSAVVMSAVKVTYILILTVYYIYHITVFR